jgi:hypothetical protein
MLEALPNLFIIGAAKSGTTTLFRALGQHPGVYLPLIKEPSFFSRDSDHEKGLGWYVESMFRRAAPFPIRVDASTQYLFWADKVAPRIKDAYGEASVRFMAVFRDPVERAYSWYWNMVAEGREDRSFAEALALEPVRYRTREYGLRVRGVQQFGYFRGGCYATNIRHFLDLFPRDRFFFVLSDDLRADFAGTLERAFQFLDLARKAVRPIHSNQAARPISGPLRNYFKHPVGPLAAVARAVYRRAPYAVRYSVKTWILNALMRPATYPPMDPVVAQELRARFADEVRALAGIIERDLSAWLPP